MALKEQFETTGSWLFSWRSYVPLALFAPLLVEMRRFDWPGHNHQLQEAWEVCCLAISFTGLAIRCVTVGRAPSGTSGRNTKRQIAESLNTTGPYSVVRHPLYLGNFLMWLGFAMFLWQWQLLAVYALAFWLYYERIMIAEEAFLRRKFGQEFVDWAARTPAIVPRFRQWQPSTLPFSMKTVLRREYSGFFGVTVVFFLLDLVGDWRVRGRIVFESQYVVLLIVGLCVYLTLRTLKKKTGCLVVEGR